MLKKLLSIVLMLAIIAQGTVSLAIYAYYAINKETIAKTLCVNKSKPMLHCQGKCYLSKQLKKAEENEKKQSQSLREKDEVISFQLNSLAIAYIPTYHLVGLWGTTSISLLSAPVGSIDQPPSAA